jgi:hypothetical protein
VRGDDHKRPVAAANAHRDLGSGTVSDPSEQG